MQPASGVVLARAELGLIAYETMLDQTGFIADDISPMIESTRNTGQYPFLDIENLIKLPPGDLKRRPYTSYAEGGAEFDVKTFKTEDRGFVQRLDETERNMYQHLFDAEVIAVQLCVDTIKRKREQRIADMIFNTANLTKVDVSIEWDTSATATPYVDVSTAKSAMRALTTLNANAVALSRKVFENVFKTAELRNKLQYTAPIELETDEVKKKILATYFGVEQILVGDAMKDSAKKGQTKSVAEIWNDEYVALLVLPKEPKNLKEPSISRTFLWTEDSPDMITTESWYDQDKRTYKYRCRHNIAEEFIFTGAGYLLGNITT